MKRYYLFIILHCIATSIFCQSVTIHNFWIEEAYDHGQWGIRAHVKFYAYGLQGRPLTAELRFYDENVRDWIGTQRTSCCNGNGYLIYKAEKTTPSYNATTYNDFTIFAPWHDLQLRREKSVYYCALFFWGFDDDGYYKEYTKSQLAGFMAQGDGRYGYGYTENTKYSTYYPGPDPTEAYRNSYANTNSKTSSSSKGRSVSSGDAILALGAIAAVGYGIYKIFSGDGSPSSNQSSSTNSGYTAKKYSPEQVARLLNSSNLYACRFKDGSNLTRIDFITRVRIIQRNSTQYMTFPDYIRGEYKIIKGHSYVWKAGMIYINEGGDNFYLMDSDKNIILY